jgi:hypothetical protein
MRWYAGEELLPFLRGAPFVEVAEGRVKIARLDPADSLSYPVGGWQHAQSTAGVRLEFATSASEVSFRAWDPGHEPEEEGLVSLWENAICIAAHSQRAHVGEVCADFTLPKEGERTYTLHLPYASRLEPIALGVPDGAGLTPVEPASRVWAAYGDSITQGRTASDPGYTYVAQTAYYAELEPLNLGFRGWARGEPAAAQMLASMDFDILSIFMGVNVRVSSWLDAAAWRETFRNFIELVRVGHPTTPILVISMLSCHGQFRDNRPDARGVTMAALREVEHEVVAQRQADGDAHIRVIDGTTIIGPEQNALLPDGTHPNDLGMNRIATRIAPELREMLGLEPIL